MSARTPRRRWATRATAAALPAVATLAACGELGLQADVKSILLAQHADTASDWKPTATTPATIGVRAPARIRVDSALVVQLLVHNGGDNRVALGYAEGGRGEMVVARGAAQGEGALTGRPSDHVVWSTATTQPGRDPTITDGLPPGRDTTFTVRWPGTDDGGHPVPPGRYRYRVALPVKLVGVDRLWSPWQEVEVVP